MADIPPEIRAAIHDTCLLITHNTLWPALRAAGIKNPERYVVAFDDAPLLGREDNNDV